MAHIDAKTQRIILNGGLPLSKTVTEVKIQITSSDTYYYYNDKSSFLDYSPNTLGFYWQENNKCLRTTKGLITKKDIGNSEIKITRFKDGKESHLTIDFEKSSKPRDSEEFYYESACNWSGKLIKKEERWIFKRDKEDEEIEILTYDLDFNEIGILESGFNIDANGVILYYQKPLENVDTKTFEVINMNYAKDKFHAYCGDTPIKESSPNDFIAYSHCHAKDNTHVYYFSSVLETADANSFTPISLSKNIEVYFFKDSNHIFCGEKIIHSADPNSFEIIKHYLAKDKKHVFYMSTIVNEADPETFEVLEEDLYKDKNNIYKGSYRVPQRICKNTETFQYLGDDYFINNDVLYYQNDKIKIGKVYDNNYELVEYRWLKYNNTLYFNGREKLQINSPESLVFLDPAYLKLDGKVYYYNNLVEDADINSFESIGEFEMARDKDNLYYRGESISGSHGNSLVFLENEYFHDKNQVYRYNEKYEHLYIHRDIDISSIKVISDFILIDDKNVYWNGDKVPTADPKSIEYISGTYFKDSNHVYSCLEKIDLNPKYLKIKEGYIAYDLNNVYFYTHKLNLDGSKLKIIDTNILMDDKNVYVGEKQVIGADPASFKIANEFYFKDKNRLYYYDKPLELDIESTQILGSSYCKDKDKVYYCGKVIDGADPKSFQSLRYSFGKDKNRVYLYDSPIEEISLDPETFVVESYSVYRDKNGFYSFKDGKLVKSSPY